MSHAVPGIHPCFYIGSEALNHTAEYTAACGEFEDKEEHRPLSLYYYYYTTQFSLLKTEQNSEFDSNTLSCLLYFMPFLVYLSGDTSMVTVYSELCIIIIITVIYI